MKVVKVLSLLGLVLVATACGNARDIGYDLRHGDYGQVTGLNTENQYLGSAEQCSSSPNVTSTQYNAGSSSQFHACKTTSQQNTVSVKIFTATDISQTVCLFPVQVNNGNAYPFVINGHLYDINRFAYRCVTTNHNTGATADFGSYQLNAVYVVDQIHAHQFANCMIQGNINNCAANFGFIYSKGML